ncbi:hypothetical protein [Amycolatopsis anabasis]|uniref:hypothetical protein n=1 Tax=Amycolatopsis anabasis TaxID=1840409 RepID=UPI00131A87B1|nr:hypothetical protein [Amycolatopsis anabasis]
MVNVEVHFTNGQVQHAEGVTVDEGLTALTVHTGPAEKTVIPLVNVQFYDIEETN